MKASLHLRTTVLNPHNLPLPKHMATSGGGNLDVELILKPDVRLVSS